MQDSARVFLGLALPEGLKQQLLAVRHPVPGAAWQSSVQLHITLRFLGGLRCAVIDDLVTALGELEFCAFGAKVSGVGCFGPPQAPRILWAGVQPEEPLQALRAVIDERLLPLALAVDEHDRFKPHITLARIKSADASATDFLQRHAGLSLPGFVISEVVLFSSQPGASGSAYRALKRFPLAPASL